MTASAPPPLLLPGAPPPSPSRDLAARALAALRAAGHVLAVVTMWLGPQKVAPPVEASADAADGPLRTLAESYPLPTWKPMARLAMALVTLFVLWAALADLDEVAVASGEVVPEGKVKVIQHLEGGVVRDIYTQDGAVVKEGEPLIQVDLPVSSLNREEVQVRLDGLVLQRARLQAELAGTPLAFPEAEAKRQPVLVDSEARNFEARRQALRASIAVLQDQYRQKTGELQELEAKQRALAANLRLSHERYEMSKELAKSGLTSRMEHVQLQSQTEELEGSLQTLRASIPRAQAAQAEAKSRIEEEQARFVRTAQNELSEAELNIARTRELLTQASDQQRRTQITSPIDGIVKNLRANTIGGVVKPGDPIMEIVPLNERLQIDAKLSPTDRGYVQVGQRATVKISAYDYTTYGGLEGEVTLVAPDTTTGQDNHPYYRVVVQTDRSWLGDESQRYGITAGMEATVEIHTGTRTVLHYLVKPVMKLRHEAFHER